MGDERIVFKVNVDATIVRVVYFLKVTKLSTDAAGVNDLLCKKTGGHWKISALPDTLGNESTASWERGVGLRPLAARFPVLETGQILVPSVSGRPPGFAGEAVEV